MVINILEDITTALASDVLKQVSNNKDQEISVNIMSRGGDMMAGNAIIQALQLSPATVTTNVYGVAASMAAAISQSGDKRYIAPDAIFQPHNGAAMPINRPTKENLTALASQLDMMDTIMLKSFAKSNLNTTQLKELLIKDTPMTAEQALSMEFFDGQLESISATAQLNTLIMSKENTFTAKLDALKAMFQPKAAEGEIIEEVIDPAAPAPDAPQVEEVAPEDVRDFGKEIDAIMVMLEELLAKISPLDAPSVEETVTAKMDQILTAIQSSATIPAASASTIPKPEPTEEVDNVLTLKQKEIQSKFKK